MVFRSARFQPQETAYYLEAGEIVAVEVLENKCTEDTVEYKLKCLELVRPGNIPVYEHGKEFTCLARGRNLKLFDEAELESYFGIRKLSEAEKGARDQELRKKEDRILELIAEKRKAYLERLDTDCFYAYHSHNGRKIAEIDDMLYADGKVLKGISVIGGLLRHLPDSNMAFEPEVLGEVVPTMQEGYRLICFQPDFQFKTEDRENEFPGYYLPSRIVKMVKANRNELSGLSVEDIVQHLYKRLEE